MSIIAEYRWITPDQLTWFTKKPSALYELLFPDSIQESSESTGGSPKAKDIPSALQDFKNFAEAIQNPGTNDELIIAKLPFMLRQWRAMIGEEGAQQILAEMAKGHPAIAEHLKANAHAAKPGKEDSHLLNIEKAWDGIHFVLTGAKQPSDNPISRALFGDRVIPDALGIMGYGPVRTLTSAQVAESARELRRLEPEFSRRFDVNALVKADVYAIHDDPEELSYLKHHYERLLRFYEEASAEGYAMAVYMV